MERQPSIAELAARGFRVFPVKPRSKIAAITNWSATATSANPAAVEQFARFPGANTAIFTGRFGDDSALIVVDVDRRPEKDGDVTLSRLRSEGCDLPKTFTVRTPSGGRHLYYRAPEAVRQGANVLGPGVDIRSAGGYVLAPGSTLANGSYDVISDAPIEHAPTWLIEKCGRHIKNKAGAAIEVDQARAAARARVYLDAATPAIEGQGGDETTYKVAARVKDFGVGEETCFAMMLPWNDRCSPPWSHEQLRQKVRNAYAYGNEAPGASAPEADFEPVETFKETRRFRAFSYEDLGTLPKTKWLIETLIPENALVVLYGPPKLGKTFWAIDVSLSVAAGRSFYGCAVQRGRVLYIAGEGSPARLGDRVTAWLNSSGVKPAAIGNWSLVAQRVNVSDRGALACLLDEVGRRFILIIVDTLNRSMDGDENSQKDMTTFVQGCDFLREETGAAVLVITHTGKDGERGIRGSTVLAGAVDTAIRARKIGEAMQIEVEMQKDAEPARPALFKIEPVVIGLDKAAHLLPLSASDAAQMRPLKKDALIAYEALTAAIDKHGELIPEQAGAPGGTRGVRLEYWREEFVAAKMATKPNVAKKSAQTAFNRAGDKLATIGHVRIFAEYRALSEAATLATNGDIF